MHAYYSPMQQFAEIDCKQLLKFYVAQSKPRDSRSSAQCAAGFTRGALDGHRHLFAHGFLISIYNFPAEILSDPIIIIIDIFKFSEKFNYPFCIFS